MASHVFVVDGRVRKIRIQTTQGTYLSDVLEQGCKKLGLKPDQFVLKHNGKLIDLSRTIRLSSLPSGAQLDLVQGSRSPTVISVALQLPENRRLTNKFPSTTSLWQILRVFETTETLNFTERAIAPTTTAGAGRLFYQMPVLNVLNREFSTLEDLQKTLSQLGVTSGSILLRLSFKDSEKPLEEAMQDISQYFKAEPPLAAPESKEDVPMTDSNPVEPSTSSTAAPQDQKPEAVVNDSTKETSTQSVVTSTKRTDENTPPVISTTSEPTKAPAPSPQAQPLSNQSPTTTPSLTVYKPTTTTTPLAATQPFNEADYIPTIEHAQTHQIRLAHQSRNKRLPSDAELARTAEAKAAVAATVQTVRVRVRLPDLTMLETTLARGGEGNNAASPAALYALVRGVMRRPDWPFVLRYVQPSGAHVALVDASDKDLIVDLGWRGNVLVSMVWGDTVDAAARRGPVLKPEAMSEAKSVSVVVPEVPEVEDDKDDKKSSGFFDGLGKAFEKGKGRLGGADKEAKLKNLLGFGKKK